mgnify:CR=1 FL=1
MVRHYALLLTGAQQNLAVALAAQFSSADEGKKPIRFLSLQAKGTATALMYYGGWPQLVSSTVYGGRIEIPAATVPAAPTMFEFTDTVTSLDQWSVLGTNASTEVLMICVID